MKKVVFLLVVFCNLVVLTASAQLTRAQVESGIQKCNSQIDGHNWSDAFATLRALDAALGTGSPELHYLVAKQRYLMYLRINKNAEAKNNLYAMEAFANKSGDNATIEDMLLVKAAYNAKTGNQQVSRQCYKAIFDRRAKGKDDDGIEKCYQQTIAEAKQKKYNAMAAVIQQMYSAWQDSIAGERSARELKDLKAQYAEAQKSIDDKDGKIAGQWAFIVILLIIAAGLGAGLAFFIFTMFRNRMTISKLRKSLDIANKSNEQKSVFIRNISGQITPSLQQIAQGNSKQHIPALQTMLGHAEEYMALESSREEKYETEDVNVGKLCEEVIGNLEGCKLSVTTDAPKISFPLNKESVEKLIANIVKEVATNDNTERVTLGFKKRNPHTGQFYITAIGMKVPEEEREQIFTAFSKIYDLTVTDGLTLPTCALMAYKMGGQLFLEEGFAKGTRFVLEIHC